MDNPEELNQLARELSGGHSENTDSAATGRFDQWLNMLVSRGGSDLLVVEDAPPCVRVQGEVRKLEPTALDGPEIEAAVLPALAQNGLRLYRETMIGDSSYRVERGGRWRRNLHRERGRASAATRVLLTSVPGRPVLPSPPRLRD